MYKNNIGKGGSMLMKLMKQKNNLYFFCYVNTWDRYRFHTYIYILLTCNRYGCVYEYLIQIYRISRPIYAGIRKYRSRPLAWPLM